MLKHLLFSIFDDLIEIRGAPRRFMVLLCFWIVPAK